jgi:hypothetical protein
VEAVHPLVRCHRYSVVTGPTVGNASSSLRRYASQLMTTDVRDVNADVVEEPACMRLRHA